MYSDGDPYSVQRDLSGRWGVGVHAAAAIPRDEDADSGFTFGGSFVYGIADYVAIGVEAGYVEFRTKVLNVDFGDLQGVPVLAIAQWRLPFMTGTSEAAVYLVGGLGVIFWNFDEDEQALGLGADIDSNTSFAAKLGGGLDWFINPNLALNFETSYMFSGDSVTLGAPGLSESAELKTDYWQVGGAIKYYN